MPLPFRSGRLKAVAVLGLLPALFLIGAFVMPDYRGWKRGVEITGVVHYVEPDNHRTVFYGYQFDGRAYQYSSQGGAGFGNPPFDSLKPGTSLHLWVDPKNPGKALPGDPEPVLLNNLAFVVPAYFLIIYFLYRGFDHLPQALRLGQD